MSGLLKLFIGSAVVLATLALATFPATAFAALAGVVLTAGLQRRHWIRTTHEEIRIRETREANELVRDIAKIFDRRIAAQRRYLRNIGSEDSDTQRNLYGEAVTEYASHYNDIRFRLMSYHSYRVVLDFEKSLNDRIVRNGEKISALEKKSSQPLQSEIRDIDEELSVISAQVFHFCSRLHDQIAGEEFGTLRKLSNWTDPQNSYVTNWWLAKRLLNI